MDSPGGESRGTRSRSKDGGSTGSIVTLYQEATSHCFTKKTFHKPVYCHHCTDLLWGIIGQGVICEGMPIIDYEQQ